MAIYYFLYALIILTPCFKRSSVNGIIEANQKWTNCMVGVLIIILALRHQSMGADLGYLSPYGYLGSYERLAQCSWRQILTMRSYLNYERGYVIFNKLISMVTSDPQWLLVCCSIASLVPIGYMIKRFSLNPKFSLIVYLGLPSFLIVYSGLRQAFAIGVCCLAYEQVIRKNPWKFTMYVLLASLFHYTAFLFIVVYPVFCIKMTKKSRLITVLIPLITYVFRNPLFSVLSRLVKSNAVAGNTGAITLFLVFLGIYLFCSIFIPEDDEIANGFLNVFLLACCCQAFSSIFSTAMRIGYYYMIGGIIALPNVVMCMKNRNSRMISALIIESIFVIYGLYAIYTSTWPRAYPYHFFWSQI